MHSAKNAELVATCSTVPMGNMLDHDVLVTGEGLSLRAEWLTQTVLPFGKGFRASVALASFLIFSLGGCKDES